MATNNLKNFRTFLWPETKVGDVGFYKLPDADNINGSVIEAPFTRAGAGRKVVDADGNLVDAAANLPAWTFPIGGAASGCPVLSFLPSVENLLTYSEQFDNAAWSVLRGTITANNATSPDGTANADLLDGDGSSVIAPAVGLGFTFPAAGTYTFSVYAEAVNDRWIELAANNFVPGGGSGFFDLQNGVVGTTGAGVTGNIVDLKNGYYHCAITFDVEAADLNGDIGIYLTEVDNSRNFSSTTLQGQAQANIWGAQLKEGSYISPLDYVKTEASAVTRNSEDFSSNALQTSGSLGANEGTVIYQIKGFEEITDGSSFKEILRISNSSNSSNERLSLIQLSSGFLNVQFWDGGVNRKSFAAIPIDGLQKLIVSYGPSGVFFYLNGFEVQSATLYIPSSTFDFVDRQGDVFTAFDLKFLHFAPTALTASQAEAASSWPSFDLMVSDLGYS